MMLAPPYLKSDKSICEIDCNGDDDNDDDYDDRDRDAADDDDDDGM